MKYFFSALDNYANFRGRATRKEYWMFVFFNILFGIIALIIDILTTSIAYGFDMGIDIILETYYLGGLTRLYVGYSLAMLIPSLAIVVRRMHDIGKSGWAIFINLIPLIGGIWYFVLLCTPSLVRGNPYSTVSTRPKVPAQKLVKTSLILTLLIMTFDLIFPILYRLGAFENLNYSQMNLVFGVIFPLPVVFLTSSRMVTWLIAFLRSKKTDQQPFVSHYLVAFWFMLGVQIFSTAIRVFNTWQRSDSGAAGVKLSDILSILVLILNVISIFLIYRSIISEQKAIGNQTSSIKLILAIILQLVGLLPTSLISILNVILRDGLIINRPFYFVISGLQATAYLVSIVILLITKIQTPTTQLKTTGETAAIG